MLPNGLEGEGKEGEESTFFPVNFPLASSRSRRGVEESKL